MKKRIFILVICVFAGFQSCYKEEIIYNSEPDRNLELQPILKINQKECCYDYIENTLRFSIEEDSIPDFSPLITFQEYADVYFNNVQLQNNCINDFGAIDIYTDYEVRVVVNDEIKKLTLSFTNLPIVQIVTPNRIFDDPKTMAKITVNYPEEEKESDRVFVGLEYRGRTSQGYPKKSYGLSLKGSLNKDDDIAASLFDVKENNDWILDAMWIDRARMRNKTSFELWKAMEGKRHFGITGNLVELYINNEHQGLYCFSDNITYEFLNLTDDNAVLYKAYDWGEEGETRFQAFSSEPPQKYLWDAWEQKYPDEKINWKPLKELRKLVVFGSDTEFESHISNMIDMDNFIDYFIFMNLVSAMDNTGKNLFYVKENENDKFYVIPWDIDGSWGLFWDGSRITYTSILSNTLYDRLMATNTENFNERVKQRWEYLRSDIFTVEKIQNRYRDNFEAIRRSGVMDIENRNWELNIDIDAEEEYLIPWIEDRISFLDVYFGGFPIANTSS